MGEFTHFNEQGHAVMVDVSEKADTMREATAMGRIHMSKECFEKVKTGGMKKGDVLGTARIAGIMGAKRTSELIPLCHILNLSKVTVEFEYIEETCEIEARCTTKTVGKMKLVHDFRTLHFRLKEADVVDKHISYHVNLRQFCTFLVGDAVV